MVPIFATALDRLTDHIARYKHRVDYLAIRLEESDSTDILLRRGKVETLSEALSVGGQVRACYRGGWGFASFNNLADLAAQIEEAIAAARLVGDDITELADHSGQSSAPSLGFRPPRHPSQSQEKSLCPLC